MKASEYQDIGHYLRDSRDSLRISVEQAASALHIRAKYLRAIESGELAELPGKAYIRGYIRNYAEYLRLDAEDVLDAYESLRAHDRDFFIPEPTLKENLPSRHIVWGVLAGLVLLYSYWYFAVHDRARTELNIPEVPSELTQMLDKNARAAMDRAWRSCMEEASDTTCFIALRRQVALPPNYVLMNYGIYPRNNSPKKP